MQEAEEQDTCRICSAPAEDGQPLFHPCKCSGTIRYIHQDCLTTWLAHSKKKSCDVCKHPYSFTKVYAADMPPKLPTTLLIRRLVAHAFYALLFGLRAVVVGTIWLAVLPLMTVWSWRMYFSMGDSTAWWISDRPQPTSDRPPFYYQAPAANVSTGYLLARFTNHPTWLHLSSDIFAGQIIASLIVLTFVAVFLLREWISQNARPGVFDDDLPEEPAQDILLPPQPQVLPPAQRDPPQRDPFADVPQIPPHFQVLERQLREQRLAALRALDEMRAADGSNGDGVGRASRARRIRTRSVREAPQADDEVTALAQRIADAVDEDANPGEQVRRNRRRLEEDKLHRALEENERRRRKYVRRLYNARIDNARRRLGVPDSCPDDQGNPEKFEFTFKVPGAKDTGPRSASISDPAAFNELFPPPGLHPTSPDIPGLPFSFPDTNSSSLLDNDLAPAPTTPYPRRPLLPTVTLPPIDFSEQPLSTTSSLNKSRTPLVSPGIATYRAPEDFDGSQSTQEYFGDESQATDEGRVHQEVSLRSRHSDALEATPMENDHYSNTRATKGKEREDHDDGTSDSGIGEFEFYFKDDADGIDAESSHSNRDIPVVGRIQDEAHPVAGGSSSGGGTPDLTLRESDTEDEDTAHEGMDRDDGEDGADRSQDEDDGDPEVDDDNDLDGPRRWPRELGHDNLDVAAREGRQPQDEDLAAALAAVQQRPQNRVADPPAAGNDEFAEGNVEDDMEGALEAIGMRGPIYGVVQNAAVMIFVLDTAIGLGIWIPFTIGKSTALLSLDPHRFLQIIHLPIKAIRIVTDPIVDSLVYLLVDIILPHVFKMLRLYAQLAWRRVLWALRKTCGQSVSETTQHYLDSLSAFLHSKAVIPSTIQHIPNSSWFANVSLPWQASHQSINGTTETTHVFPEILGPTQPFFIAIGREVRTAMSHGQVTWKRMALGQGPTERAFAVILGYCVVGLILAIYLNFLTVGNVKNAGRAVRGAVRQQLLVLKVAAFIFIELVTFPLGCGIVLDLCTVWLFPEASLFSRAIYFFQAPLTAMFYHWVAGTMFMYSFAILLSGCRTIMRPGAMWFIKDPQDQNSHPIRDILDRPTMTQLRKIFISGLMYSFVVVCVVSSVAGLLLLGSKSIMPFRWKNREPLSSIPIDLVFLHAVLPYTMHYLRPRRGLKKVSTWVWAFIARRLRLSSYFFGGRHPAEEYATESWITNILNPDALPKDSNAVWNGQLRRVPATDHIALPRDMRATVQVDTNGEPIDDDARNLMALQDAEAVKSKRNPKDDYTVVYLPPQFRVRVIAFIAILWVVGAIVLGIAVALPIQLGRSFFRLFVPYDVHDGYSFIIGFYLLWACYLVGRSIDRLDKRRQRRGGDAPRADLRFLVFKRGLLWLVKIAYLVFCLGIVLPTLLSITVDLYVVLPIRLAVSPELTPRIRIVDSWALGLLYGKMALFVHGIRPRTPIGRGLLRIKNNGWTHPDPVSATTEVIIPLIGGLIGMILLPAIMVVTMHSYLPFFATAEKFAFINVYPGIFLLAGTAESASLLLDILSSWSQSIRDKEFLVEMRLRNHEPADANQPVAGAESVASGKVGKLPAD